MRIMTFRCIIAIALCILIELKGGNVKKEIHPSRSSAKVLLPFDSDELAWRYDARLGQMGACSTCLYELNTPELIEWRIKQMKAQGFNSIMLSGIHFHQDQLEKWPNIVKYTKMVTECAHKNGMKVIFHHDAPIIKLPASCLKHPDWLMQDIKYGIPALSCFCFNNPNFKKAYFDRIEKLVKETNVDGLQIDELYFPRIQYCGCKYCRELFTMKTGLVLPYEYDSKVFYNMKDPTWVAWLNWRKSSIGDWWVEMRGRLNKIKPNLSIMMYTTHYGFINVLRNGFDLLEMARGCDWLGTEIMPRNVYDSFRPIFANRKAFAGLGKFYNSPIHAWLYSLYDSVYAYFGWAMNHMNGQVTIMADRHIDGMSRYLNWPMRMDCRYACPKSDVAIVFSKYSRDFGERLNILDVLGTSEYLSDAHIQHDIIMNDALDSQELQKYKILMLTSAEAMSEKEIKLVRQYVSGGGTLFVSGKTSLYDENGFRQTNFQLADLLGVDNINGNSYKAPVNIKMEADGKSITIPTYAMKVKLRPGTKLLGEILDGKSKPAGPGIVSNIYGKGKCFYSTIPLGKADYEWETRSGRVFKKNYEIYNFYISLFKEMTHDNLDFKAINIPEKVLVNVFLQNVKDKQEILIHLLNATGTARGFTEKNVVQGKSDWKKRGNPFPPLTEDIVFDIRPRAEISNAIVVSPDYKDERSVTIEKKDNEYYKVIVKKEDLQAYSIVYLELLNE